MESRCAKVCNNDDRRCKFRGLFEHKGSLYCKKHYEDEENDEDEEEDKYEENDEDEEEDKYEDMLEISTNLLLLKQNIRKCFLYQGSEASLMTYMMLNNEKLIVTRDHNYYSSYLVYPLENKEEVDEYLAKPNDIALAKLLGYECNSTGLKFDEEHGEKYIKVTVTMTLDPSNDPNTVTTQVFGFWCKKDNANSALNNIRNILRPVVLPPYLKLNIE